jgi:hypothetical protein
VLIIGPRRRSVVPDDRILVDDGHCAKEDYYVMPEADWSKLWRRLLAMPSRSGAEPAVVAPGNSHVLNRATVEGVT